jgi:hypothetical protein
MPTIGIVKQRAYQPVPVHLDRMQRLNPAQANAHNMALNLKRLVNRNGAILRNHRAASRPPQPSRITPSK